MRVLVLHNPENKPKHLRFPKEIEAEITPSRPFDPEPRDAVMHWGLTSPPLYGIDQEIAGASLNAPDVVTRCMDTEYVTRLWKAHGISTRYFERARRRRPKVGLRYRIHIFDLRIMSIARYSKGRYRPIRGGGKRMQFVRRMAVRCLYVLGLHFGCIDVASISKKHAVPLNFDPFPRLTRKSGRRYGEHASKYVHRLTEHPEQILRPALIGADLEFIMRRPRGRVLYASRYFSRHGRVGHDQQGSRRVRGRYPIVEIRPSPVEDPPELVDGIHKLLRRAARRTPKKRVSWEAGSHPVSGCAIGGHIHFSRVDLTTELLRALDNYLAVPVMMLENPSKARRRRPHYGHLGEFRWKSYGGFEYRTLSSWIVAPQYALAVVTLAKLIIDNYPKLQRNILPSVDDVAAFYRCDKEAMRANFEEAWKDLERLDDYEKVAEQLEVIPNLVRQGKQWLETHDFRGRWGLLPKRKRRKRRRRR